MGPTGAISPATPSATRPPHHPFVHAPSSVPNLEMPPTHLSLTPQTILTCPSNPIQVLDAVLLRVVPAGLYTAALYPLVRLTAGARRVASFALVLATFAACVGALALSVATLARSAGA